jgi:hypothetical protein
MNFATTASTVWSSGYSIDISTALTLYGGSALPGAGQARQETSVSGRPIASRNSEYFAVPSRRICWSQWPAIATA